MSSSKFEILQIEFPDTAQKFLVPRNLFPDNLLRELREKSLQHSRILHRTWLAGRQNRKFPCKIPCYQGSRMETGAISTASPANQSGTQRKCPFYPQKSPPMAGFCKSGTSLQAPVCGIF
jgi:hypothetical protein